MYCSNCGKETSNAASFCPYCWAKTEGMQPEMNKGAAAHAVSVRNEDGELPVYKRRKKAALFVSFVPLICVILKLLLVCMVMGVGLQ